MRLIKFFHQLLLIITILLFSNNIGVEAGFMGNSVDILASVWKGFFRGIGYTLEAGYNLINVINELLKPPPNKYEELLNAPPVPLVPWSDRVRASDRGVMPLALSYSPPSPYAFSKPSGQIHANLGNQWSKLIEKGEYIKKLENSTNSYTQSSIQVKPLNSTERDRLDTASYINNIIMELNKKFGNGTHTYSDEVYQLVVKITELINSPGFDSKDESTKHKIDDYISEISIAYNRGILNSYNVNLIYNPTNSEDNKSLINTRISEFDDLIYMLEDMGTTDPNVISEYITAFCNKYYKEPEGNFNYLIEGIIYNLQNFIISKEFEFPGDPSTIELVRYIREIESVYFAPKVL